MQLKRTAMITAVSVATALSSTATMAAPLTFTELFNPAEINDPKNVVASIMNRLWKNDKRKASSALFLSAIIVRDACGAPLIRSATI